MHWSLLLVLISWILLQLFLSCLHNNLLLASPLVITLLRWSLLQRRRPLLVTMDRLFLEVCHIWECCTRWLHVVNRLLSQRLLLPTWENVQVVIEGRLILVFDNARLVDLLGFLVTVSLAWGDLVLGRGAQIAIHVGLRGLSTGGVRVGACIIVEPGVSFEVLRAHLGWTLEFICAHLLVMVWTIVLRNGPLGRLLCNHICWHLVLWSLLMIGVMLIRTVFAERMGTWLLHLGSIIVVLGSLSAIIVLKLGLRLELRWHDVVIVALMVSSLRGRDKILCSNSTIVWTATICISSIASLSTNIMLVSCGKTSPVHRSLMLLNLVATLVLVLEHNLVRRIVVCKWALLAIIILAIVSLNSWLLSFFFIVFTIAVIATSLMILIYGPKSCCGWSMGLTWTLERLLQSVGVASVSLLLSRWLLVVHAICLVVLVLVRTGLLVHELTRSSRTDARGRLAVGGRLSEWIRHIVFARVGLLVDQGRARLIHNLVMVRSYLIDLIGLMAAMRLGLMHTTEPTRIEFLVPIRVLLNTVSVTVPFSLVGLMELRIVETVWLEHDNLVVALVVLILGMIRDPTLRGDLARALWRMQLMLVLIVILEVPALFIITLHLASHRGFTLREAARDSTWAEVTPIWQILESHLGLLGIVSTAVAATANIDSWAAWLIGRNDGWLFSLVLLVTLLITPRRTHSERGILLIGWMTCSVTIVLLLWMRVGIHDWVFIEHLSICLIFLQRFKIGDLVFDLGLNTAEFLWNLSIWKSSSSTIAIHKAGTILVLRHDMAPATLWAIDSRDEVVWASIGVLSKGWHLILQASLVLFSSTFASLSDTLSLVHLISHHGHLVVRSLQTSLAAESRLLAIGTCASWAGWTKVHSNCYRHFFSNLISSAFHTLLLLLCLVCWIKLILRTAILVQIFSSTNACTVFNFRITVNLVTEFKASTVLVLAATIASQLSLTWGTIVSHRNIVLPRNMTSDWRHILHLSVSIRCILHGWTCLNIVRAILRIPISCRTHILVLNILIIVYLTQAPIKSIFIVLGHRLVNSSLVWIGWLETLWNVLSIPSIISLVDFLVVSPPLGVNHRIKTCWTGPFLLHSMGILNLKPVLGTVPRHSTGHIFRAFSAPRWRRLFHDFSSIALWSILFQIVCDLISCWPIGR